MAKKALRLPRRIPFIGTLVITLVLLVGLVFSLQAVQQGTNLFSQAKSNQAKSKYIKSCGSDITVTGKLMRVKTEACSDEIRPPFTACYKLTQTGDKKEYLVIACSGSKINLEKYLGQRVAVKGTLSRETIVASEITYEMTGSLELIPTLGSGLGTASIQASWSAADGAEVTIKRSNGQVVPGGEKFTTTTETNHTFSLTGLANGDYYAELIITKDGKTESLRRSFEYFEDGFEGNKLNNWWTKKDQEGNELVSLGNGQLTLGEHNNGIDGDAAGLVKRFPVLPAGNFDISTTMVSLNADLGDDSGAGLLLAGKNSVFAVSRAKNNRYGSSVQGWIDGAEDKFLPLSLPVVFGIAKKNGVIYTIADGQVINSAQDPSSSSTEIAIDLVANQYQPDFPGVTASFDNFRLIWVK